MEPLSVLRDFTIRGDLDKIVRVNDDFHFGADYSFPCATNAAYNSKTQTLYTLETLFFFLQNSAAKHGDYLQAARSFSIPSISFIDRKPLLDYLTGHVPSTNYAVPDNLLPSSSSTATASTAAPAADGGDDSGNGKPVDYLSMIYSVERPLKDRESLLECRNRDFYSVLVASTRREEERQRIESQQRKDGLVAKTRLMGNDERGFGFGEEIGKYYDSGAKSKIHLKSGKLGVGEGVPIILVPSAFHTLITIYNVKEFLEDGVFVPTDVKVKQMKGPKPDCVTVQKKFSTDRNRVMMAYEVRDKPSALKAEDWDRVVAAFVLGKEWQFKDWPFKDHVEIFNKIAGFFVRFEDDSVESAKNVKQWDVKIISISKNKRHQDRTAALQVWDRLEEFVRSRSHS